MPDTNDSGLIYLALSGPGFEDAISGNGGNPNIPAWLASPKLRYFEHRSALLLSETDQRTFFLALTSPKPDDGPDGNLARAIGILELQVSPYDDHEVWLKYITVDPDYQRRGVSKKLLDMMVALLRDQDCLLSRSRPGKDSPPELQHYIDHLLDGAGIRWMQSGREEQRRTTCGAMP